MPDDTLVSTTASAAILTGILSPMDSLNGHSSTVKPGGLKHRRAPTFATGRDIFPKKERSFSSSLEGLKPQLGPKATPETKPTNFPRISKPVELLRHEYDVVVIGSGYGGSVAASRMARARQSVCLLELGREKWPGEYPDTTLKALKQMHVSGDFVPSDTFQGAVAEGDATDLYHLILGEGQNAFVANGLGGTSLLNANVFLEADHRTMAMSPWPKEIRNDPSCLDPYYQRARKMLEPKPYPNDWPRLPKMETLHRQAEALGYGAKWREVDQTTRFQDGLNSCGVRMNKSKLTGMDSTGLNDGSKSSTLVNYLADAWNWGAEMFCACEVRYIVKHPKEGHLIFFAWHGCRRQKFKDIFYQDLMWVHAKKMVFLGAGTLGTTEILLRSQEMGLRMSDTVGQNMSGNGDMLAFGYNMKDTVRAMGKPNPSTDEPIGPTITSIVDCRDQENPLDGFVIEEGAVPEALVPFMQTMLDLMPGKVRPNGLTRSERLKRLIASARSRFFGFYSTKGSLEKTQVYLIMCHDDNQAVLSLRNNKPYLQFRGVGRAEHVRKLNKKLEKATNALEGTFIDNPFAAVFSGQEITVHPIGGASMSNTDSADNGVTNHLGEILVDKVGGVHDGLAVVDGSVIPTALGANPFATITAIAERSVEKLAEKHGLAIDYETRNGELDFFKGPEHPLPEVHINKDAEFVRQALVAKKHGLEFTEMMTGHIHIGHYIEEYEVAERLARGHCEEARFFLSVHAYDADTFLSSDEHKAMLTGTFTSGALPGSPYMVTGGSFQLFNDDPRIPDTKNLTYDFDMVGIDGSVIHFNGYKVINDLAAFSVPGTWKATTTLMVTLTDRKKPDDEKFIGRGMLYLDPYDLIHELKTFYSSIHSAKAFLSYFVKELAHVFFAPFDLLDWPQFHYESWPQKNEPSRIFQVAARDGVHTALKMWEPHVGTDRRDMDVFFVPGAAVDESIFALDTIDLNAITYFRKKGYRCFCQVHRVGKTPLAKQGYTTYHARLDVAAAIDKIQALREDADPIHPESYPPLGTSKTYIIAHCAGSMALSMGLLDGSVDTSSIAGITASNVFMDPKFAFINNTKASFPLPLPSVYSLLTRSEWFDCTSMPTDTFVQLGLNQLLRFYPPPSKSDICNSVVCHRSSLAFGMLWKHQNLNQDTHRQLEKIVGGTSMKSLKHLMAMGTKGTVLTAGLEDSLVNEENIERLRGIPIFLFSGEQNSVYDPESTKVSFDRLQNQLGEQFYRREVIPDYGHLDCWMGTKAYKKIYPKVLEHLELVGDYVADKGVNGFEGIKTNGHAH